MRWEDLKKEYILKALSCGLSPGDKAKITRKAYDGENGWANCWGGSMSSLVGQVVTIDFVNSATGSVGIKESRFVFPYFVFEKEETSLRGDEDILNVDPVKINRIGILDAPEFLRIREETIKYIEGGM